MPVYRGYCRVSTEEQGRKTSLKTQLEYLKHRAEVLKLEFLCYSDTASGKNFDRPSYQRLLKDIQPGDIIGCQYYDRLGRDALEVKTQVKELSDKGIIVEIGGTVIDLNDANSSLIFGMQNEVAEFFRRNQKTKSLQGIKYKQETGNWVFGGKLQGYKVINGKAEIVQKEADIITFMAKSFIEGDSFYKISKRLKEQGVLTRRGVDFTPTQIRRILLNPIYTGRYIPRNWLGNKLTLDINKICNADLVKSKVYPPIISEEDYNIILDSKRGIRRKHARQFQYRYRNFLLTGIIECGNCSPNRVAYVHSFRKLPNSNTSYEVYTSRIHNPSCNNNFKSLRKEDFNFLITEMFYLLFLYPEQLGDYIEEKLQVIKAETLSEIAKQDNKIDEIKRIEKERKKKEDKLKIIKGKIITEEDEAILEVLYEEEIQLNVELKSLDREKSLFEERFNHVTISTDIGDITVLASNEDIVGNVLEIAYETLTKEFSENMLVQFIKAQTEAEKRIIFIKAIKRVYVETNTLYVIFKNNRTFKVDLERGSKKIIVNKFIVATFYKDVFENNFLIDYQNKSVSIIAEYTGNDFGDLWLKDLESRLVNLRKNISQYISI